MKGAAGFGRNDPRKFRRSKPRRLAEDRWPGQRGDPPDLPARWLPEKRWHTLRHTFGTHAALLGVNPWRLQSWMGHKRIDETMIYVHVAENHRREIPESIVAAGDVEKDPDRRILTMLGARGSHVAASRTKGQKPWPVRWWR